MNRMSWLLVVPLALASALSVPMGCVEFDTYFFDSSPDGGSGGKDGGTDGTGGTGGMSECMIDSECMAGECRSGGTCNAGTCEWATVNMPGTPVGTQVYGDCKQRECSADGAITEVGISGDEYDWGNPCYLDGCNAWNAPKPAGPVQCTTTWNKLATCIGLLCIDCMEDSQCPGAQCVEEIGKCVPLHCSNNSQDGVVPNVETDVDCGGPCAPCAAGLKCALRSDCEGDGQCIGNPKICQAPTCSDNIKNGDETGLDCGGSCPNKCGPGMDGGCHLPSDCAAGLSCKKGKCEP
ncbi:hypothetical protein [Polyangium sorediatum]|uniref:Tryptophan synthase alpha chain n=1 Tax=Polyangium sorediatum TaxID=889274 RepID=A0ABT6PAE1_9BACT|nr:hypothetical protein [Polyangium sorediatum]MDI1437536.1 hypothetical protein [Polyangium sorediatum]